MADHDRALALGLGRDVEIGEGTVPWRELPDGITLLFGTGADAEAYMTRRDDPSGDD